MGAAGKGEPAPREARRRPPITFAAMSPKTWVLTGSLENLRATREHGCRMIGMKEGRRGMAEQVASGDLIAFYVTGVQAFGGIVRA